MGMKFSKNIRRKSNSELFAHSVKQIRIHVFDDDGVESVSKYLFSEKNE